MERFIKTTSNFIFFKQKSILSSAIFLSVMIVLARIFGFFRYRALAQFFTKEQLDIFFASFRIPDLLFEILITGALTSSFIPIYIKFRQNKKELGENISSIFNLILVLMLVFLILITPFLHQLMTLITPGYPGEKIDQIVYFSYLLLYGQLPFLVIGNFLTGIGQANKTFFLPALAPIVYNIAIIAVAIFFSAQFSLLAPVLGVILGAFILFLIQLPLLSNSNFIYSFVLKKTEGLVEFVRIVIPRVFTVLVAQIDATIDLTLTTFLTSGSYTVFYLAQHLQLLPVSVIGMAFGQASLPYLSEIYQERKLLEFKKIITDSLLNLVFLTLPIASFFIFARTPLVRLFFGGQKFDWEATVSTATTLSYFSLSLPFHSVYYLLTRCFYAALDSKTPFYISLISVAVNTAFSILFIFFLHLPVWSLAVSFSLSIILNSSLLFLLLTRKLSGFDLKLIFVESGKITIVTFLSSVCAYAFMKLLDGLVFDTTRTVNVFFLICLTGLIYLLTYLFFSWLINLKEIYLITKLLSKIKEYQRKITEIYFQYE